MHATRERTCALGVQLHQLRVQREARATAVVRATESHCMRCGTRVVAAPDDCPEERDIVIIDAKTVCELAEPAWRQSGDLRINCAQLVRKLRRSCSEECNIDKRTRSRCNWQCRRSNAAGETLMLPVLAVRG